MQVSMDRSRRSMSPSARIRAKNTGGSALAPRDGATMSADLGDVYIEAVQQPGTLEVGGTKSFHFDIGADSTAFPSDPDWCIASGFGDGYAIDITARSGGGLLHAKNTCIQAGFTRPPQRFSFELTGSSAGTVEVRVAVHGSGSRNLLVERTFQVEVIDPDGGGGGGNGGSVDPGDPPGGDNGDGGGPLLPCWIDPNRGCATPEAIAWGGLALFSGIFLISLKT